MTDCKYSGKECDSKRCTDDCEFRAPKYDQSTDMEPYKEADHDHD